MKIELGRRVSQKTLAMQRCFREGGQIEKLYTQLQTVRAAVRHDQARLASNLLSEVRWHTLSAMLGQEIPEGEKKGLRRMVKEVKGAMALLQDKANSLKPLDEREKEEVRQRLDHLMFGAQQQGGFALHRCGGLPERR